MGVCGIGGEPRLSGTRGTLEHTDAIKEGIPMRPAAIAGILLVLVGVFILVNGGSFTTRKDVLKVGDVKISADEKQSIPPWVAVVGIVAGVGLVATSQKKK